MVEVTRETLADGSVLAFMREVARTARHPEFRPLSDAALSASLGAALARWDGCSDVWLFGYGSLIWNPVIRYSEERICTLHGWHRRFCLWMFFGRGTPDRPGLMLGLDRGGSCRGAVFRIPAAVAPEELRLIWVREMAGGLYEARHEHVETEAGPVRAITFVVNSAHTRYAGMLPEEIAAAHIAAAEGSFGSCAEYLLNTAEGLVSLGLHDSHVERVADRVRQLKGLPPGAAAPHRRHHARSCPKF